MQEYSLFIVMWIKYFCQSYKDNALGAEIQGECGYLFVDILGVFSLIDF